jgi:hypothetical protein
MLKLPSPEHRAQVLAEVQAIYTASYVLNICHRFGAVLHFNVHSRMPHDTMLTSTSHCLQGTTLLLACHLKLAMAVPAQLHVPKILWHIRVHAPTFVQKVLHLKALATYSNQ